MMGHREPLKYGHEWDALTRWRRHLRKRAGKFKRTKIAFNRRVRRTYRIDADVIDRFP